MEKPFDPQDLVERLKANGMPVVESAAKVIAEQVMNWISDSVLLTPNKYDDIAVLAIGALKPVVMQEIAKIDGK